MCSTACVLIYLYKFCWNGMADWYGTQILWFAAFVAVAAYTNSGVSAGEKKGKKKGCDAFPDGPGEAAKACTLNHDLVGLGVIMWYVHI